MVDASGEHVPLQLESDRLTLRRLKEADAAEIFHYRSLPEVAKYQSWTSFSLADAENLVAFQATLEPDAPGTWLQMAIVENETTSVVGDCGIHFLAELPNQVELGITLAPTFQRRGYAFEALESVLDHLFHEMSKHRVIAVVDPDNRAAVNLFTELGFRQEAHHIENVWHHGRWGSELTFAMLAREWV